MSAGARLVVGILIGALVALVVYYVGTDITQFRREGLLWGVIALLIWAAIAWVFYTHPYRRRPVP